MRNFGPYQIQAVNGLSGDPAAYCFINRTGEAVLFDLGDLAALSNKDLLRVRHVFISHTHMDHFIGFDRLLRVHVPHRKPLSFVGPPGLAENIRHKILGYTWNLIESDQLSFEVTEVWPSQGRLKRFSLSKRTDFQLIKLDEKASEEPFLVAHLTDHSQVFAVSLDHKGIPSIAYKLQAPVVSKIRSENLVKLGLKAGSWIKELQSRVLKRDLNGTLSIDGITYPLQKLADELVLESTPMSFCYLTDVSFDQGNLQLIQKNFKPVSIFMSECSFADKDVYRAIDKAHLTSHQAAIVAASLEAGELMVFHVSGIYGGDASDIEREALESFARLSELSLDQLLPIVQTELDRCQKNT